MKRITLWMVATLLTIMPAIAPITAQAQTKTPVARERQENQKDRIKEGIKDDDLTRREAARLKAEQAKIEADKLKAKADDKVTAAERAKIQREQNQASRNIAKQKNDKQERKR